MRFCDKVALDCSELWSGNLAESLCDWLRGKSDRGLDPRIISIPLISKRETLSIRRRCYGVAAVILRYVNSLAIMATCV